MHCAPSCFRSPRWSHPTWTRSACWWGWMWSTRPANARRQALHALGPKWVLVKGGHLRSAPHSPDLLFDGAEFHRFDAPRVDTGHDHGAGDTLAAATAAALAHGHSVPEAVECAKRWITECP